MLAVLVALELHRLKSVEDAFVALAPTVVIGRHGNGRQTNLCLPGKARLGHVRHTNDFGTPAAVHVALRLGRERRALHVHVDPPPVVGNLVEGLARLLQVSPEHVAQRACKRDVAYNPLFEKRGRALHGSVDELVELLKEKGVV